MNLIFALLSLTRSFGFYPTPIKENTQGFYRFIPHSKRKLSRLRYHR